MQLEFDIGRRSKYWTVNVWTTNNLWDDPEFRYREYLEEDQYDRLAQWCYKTFHKDDDHYRVRRMSYADFWFKSKRDLDWFIFCWSGVDKDSV